MKKAFQLFALILVALNLNAQIVITEIMYNPPEPGTDTLEFVELFNNSNDPVDVSNWTFTQGFDFTFPTGTVMPPKTYVVIAKDAPFFQSKFGFLPFQFTGALTNNPGEDIELRNANNVVIDYVDYKNSAPWPPEANGNGPSLVLCDPNSDNSLPENWIAATTPTGIFMGGKEVFANPGAPSLCPTSIQANNDVATVITGNTVSIDVLLNDFRPNPLTAFQIIGAPAHGVAAIVNDKIDYTPNAGYCGPDQLIYRICDANACDEAVVNITVECLNLCDIPTIKAVDVNGVALALGQQCIVEGVTHGVNLRPSGLSFTIIDNNNNGIAIFRNSGNLGYTVTEGDRIRVTGTVGQFNGLVQLGPDMIELLSTGNPLATPTVVTKPTEATESNLIRINNLNLINPAQWTPGMGSGGFNVLAVSPNAPGDTVLIRINSNVETYNAPVPPQPFNLTGIGSQFDNSQPYTSGYQVLPRYNNDISTLSSVKRADFSSFVKVSPNPVSNWLSIQSTEQIDALQLYDANGKLLLSTRKPDRDEHISFAGLPAGTYYLQVFRRGEFWTTTVVKN
ncbi:MAG: lamin tail domain-containing protein [Saprospiraceae bacterium]